jgi:hypothetical protein
MYYERFNMVTAEMFYECFEAYNTTWLPVLIIFWLALIICTYLLFAKPNGKTKALMKACLALIFVWNGVVFFFMYMKSSAVPGGIPMLAVGILFAVDVFRDKIKFGLPETKWHKYITLSLIVWALGLYTLAGWLIGHPYPGGPLPVAPCPMTIFAIALLSASMATLKTDRIPFTLLFILLLWWAFLAGLGAPFRYGFYVDLTLFGVGIYGLIMLIKSWKMVG